jgi:hypothetical protein
VIGNRHDGRNKGILQIQEPAGRSGSKSPAPIAQLYVLSANCERITKGATPRVVTLIARNEPVADRAHVTRIEVLADGVTFCRDEPQSLA